MKIGMNLLLWTGHMSEQHIPILKDLKQAGFDGVGIPLFDVSDTHHYRPLATVLDDLGLERTTVAVIPDVGAFSDANIEEKDPIAAFQALHASGNLAHVHISENDRGTPGRGQARIRETIAALKQREYDGWLTIEAFGRGVPELAAATRVWRDFFASPEEVYTEGYRFIRDCWEGAS